MSSEEGESRRAIFKKKNKKNEVLRRQRNELSVELRKIKKVDNMSKRRNMVEIPDDDDDVISDIEGMGKSESMENNSSPHISKAGNKNIEMSLKQMFEGITQTQNETLQLKCTKGVRRILSRIKTPPIDEVLNYGFGPYLVEFLTKNDRPQLQFEATWALTNIASGSSLQTRKVVILGAVEHFITLLSSEHNNVAEQAVWALGNIAGDGSELRDTVINLNCIPPLLKLITSDAEITFLRNLTWTLSNLCRNKNPSPELAGIIEILPALRYLIEYNDEDVVSDACWAISYITDGDNKRIDLVMDALLVPILMQILRSNTDSKLLAPAIRAVGNIVTGTDKNTQIVMDYGLLPLLKKLLNHPKCTIQKESAWTLSNVVAGTQKQIQEVFDLEIMSIVMRLTKFSDPKTQRELAWVYSNISTGGSAEQIFAMVNMGCIQVLCKLLTIKDSKLILVVLETLNNILKITSNNKAGDQVIDIMEECGGLDHLDNLQQHTCMQVYHMATNLLEKYFFAKEEMPIEQESEDIRELVPKINERTDQFEIISIKDIESQNTKFNF